MAKDSIIYNHDGMELPVDDWKHGEHSFVEFEQHGKDRAEYGSQLLKKLEERVNRKGLNVTLFKNARNFYLLYPQMVDNFVFLNVPLSNCEGIPKSPTVLDQLKTSGKFAAVNDLSIIVWIKKNISTNCLLFCFGM